MLNIIPSPSASFAITLPTSVEFSSKENSLEEVIIGLLSLIFITLIDISCVVSLIPSFAVTVA